MLKQTQTRLFRLLKNNLLLIFVTLFAVTTADAQGRRQPKPPGVPAEIQITPYKTTMIADGKDVALINVKIIDSHGDSVANAKMPLTFHIKGDAKILTV